MIFVSKHSFFLGSLKLMPPVLVDSFPNTAINGIWTSAEEVGFRVRDCGLRWKTVRLDNFLQVQMGAGLAIAYSDFGMKRQEFANGQWQSAAVQVQISPHILEEAAGVWQDLFPNSRWRGIALRLERSTERGTDVLPANRASVHGASTGSQLAGAVSFASLLPESSRQRRGLKRYPERHAPAANAGAGGYAGRCGPATRFDSLPSASSQLAGVEASSSPLPDSRRQSTKRTLELSPERRDPSEAAQHWSFPGFRAVQFCDASSSSCVPWAPCKDHGKGDQL